MQAGSARLQSLDWKMAEILKVAVGAVRTIRPISANKIVVGCDSSHQQTRVMRLTKIGQVGVRCSVPQPMVEGVVRGIPRSVPMDKFLRKVELFSRGCFVTKLARSFLFHLCPSTYRNLSPVLLFTHQLLQTYLQFSSSDCRFCLHRPFTYISLFATSLFLYGPLETWHVDSVPRPVSLEDGILMIEVSVGLQPLSANTSLWPGLQLDGRGTFLVGVFHRGQSGVFNP